MVDRVNVQLHPDRAICLEGFEYEFEREHSLDILDDQTLQGRRGGPRLFDRHGQQSRDFDVVVEQGVLVVVERSEILVQEKPFFDLLRLQLSDLRDDLGYAALQELLANPDVVPADQISG